MNNESVNVITMLMNRHAITIRWCILIYYLFIVYYGTFQLDLENISHPSFHNLKDHWWKCLTTWNLVLQVRYSVMSCLMDCIDCLNTLNLYYVQKAKKTIHKIHDYCFIALDLPSTLFVCGIYWLLVMRNMAIFFPNKTHVEIPDWYNHAVHTVPAFVSIMYTFIYSHSKPEHITYAFIGYILYYISYILLLWYTHASTGHWIYIVIHDIEKESRIKLFTFLATCLIIPLTIISIFYKINSPSLKIKV